MPKTKAEGLTATSPWTTNLNFSKKKTKQFLGCIRTRVFTLEVYLHLNSAWLEASWAKGSRVCFRVAFFPQGPIDVAQVIQEDLSLLIQLRSKIGLQTARILVPRESEPILRYTTVLRCHESTYIPYWPRDVMPLAKTRRPLKAKGKVYASQVGARSGLLHFGLPKPMSGSVFYFQNLSALSAYCESTKTSVADSVGGKWPEMGFALPPAKESPLASGKDFTICDALVSLHESPDGENEVAQQFLDSLANTYLQLALPATDYPDWPEIAKKSLRDLENCSGCWSHTGGHDYLNAYLCDYESVPESMVQLAVLLPLLEYEKWLGQRIPLIEEIERVLPHFYDAKIGCVARWLPAKEKTLTGEEEQKKPRVMDSWYQLHTLLNLSRMALKGNKTAKKLFLDSVDYAIKVARRFKYRWPVFYNVDTLEVVKAETKPGEGGEKDVSGSYAHVMLQALELTGDGRSLSEAKKAARAIEGAGMNLLYQANNTAFASGALLRLWKITRNPRYLHSSYVCLANLFKNVRLWEENYGFGKNHPTFFALFPLDDAPYTAVYEEQEVFSALSNYIVLAEGEDILPSIRLLIAEFIRYAGHRSIFYYPPLLPEEMLADETKTGELNKRLWIPIEDMHQGWQKSGVVGQEVYGAGQAFGFVCRHVLQVQDEGFQVFVDYPITKKHTQPGLISFKVGGDPRLKCSVRLIPIKGTNLKGVTLRAGERKVKGVPTREGHLEFALSGNETIKVSWKKRFPNRDVMTEASKLYQRRLRGLRTPKQD